MKGQKQTFKGRRDTKPITTFNSIVKGCFWVVIIIGILMIPIINILFLDILMKNAGDDGIKGLFYE